MFEVFGEGAVETLSTKKGSPRKSFIIILDICHNRIVIGFGWSFFARRERMEA